MHFSWQTVAAQVLILVATWIFGSWLLSPLRRIPGPTLASFSRLWHIIHIFRGDQNTVLDELHEKYGSFVRVAPNEVSVSHPEAIKKILLAPLHKSNFYKAMALPDYRFQTPMSTTDPHEKNERSRHFAAGYKMSNVLQNEGAIDSTIRLFLNRLDNFAESGKAFDLDKYFTFLAFDIVGEMMFSKQFGFLREDKDIGNSIRNGPALSLFVSVMAYTRWLHVTVLANPFVTWLGILPMGHIYNTAVKALDDRKGNQDSRFDATAHWFRAVEKNPDRVSELDVYAQTTGAVGAGSDTISCALQAFVYYMLRHPNAWQRARDEIDEAIKTHGICQDPVVTFADTLKLPFLQACIKEAMRVFAPVPMGLPRVVPEGGLDIGDQHFTKGTIVSINSWVLHRDKEIWGPDAHEFNPDRWLKDNSSHLDNFFMPWGWGYNSCPGQHLAKIELSKVTATLVRDYNVRQADPNQEWQWKAYFTMVPHSWPCHVERRN
ncbi:Pisatin demethylase-like protein [Hapsidospora chrysogenum ATCC 11550]|uniref:Pisatin demethylase-like protein n=1 Tax=Hapsidospora chrysogenum (strain ATCC 11550 / CBS 779.69 / DSM 880 / IAM 14645 / JCM 23072 / IMI 49137) TaxID=857340 RepID=A0A086TDE6_HAPC1|nr:Pisatin demethylase-like protein [Hapsidospora chrysogenum ATCC 11550]